jgi:1-acyl-sn-glycerol-3-phosphate acyltransferase
MIDNRPRPSAVVVVRALAFTLWLYGMITVIGLAALPLLLGPRAGVMWLVRRWVALVMWGLKVFAGQTVEFRGLEHRPQGPAIIACKHLGMLDTIVPFLVLPDPCFVLKRELIKLPIYGWFAGKTGMIPVNRGGGSQAVRDLSAAALDRLREERQIVIFPEGTRKPLGAEPHYKGGVAALYRDLGLPCTPMATNSGAYWPAHGFVRRPGVVVFEFLEPIPPGLSRAEFMRRLEVRIENASNALLAEAGIVVPKRTRSRKKHESAAHSADGAALS